MALICTRISAVLLVCLLLGACGGPARTEAKLYSVGERVEVGPLIYRVLDMEWQEQIGEGENARFPRNRFLIVQLSVTNSGAANSAIPALKLVDARGNALRELADGRGVPEWLGYLRSVKPAQTEHGRVLFDVPAAPYRLEVTDDREPDAQQRALVDLPLQFVPPPERSGQ